MSGRKWPELNEIFGNERYGERAVARFHQWLENNLPEDTLNKIAPIEVEEPITITKSQFYRALADEMKKQYTDQNYMSQGIISKEPPIAFIEKCIGGLWGRLK
jgi:hypothetical protein